MSDRNQPFFGANRPNNDDYFRHQNPYLQGGQYGAQNGFMNQAKSALFGGSQSDRFIKGLLIGAAATFLLTNEKAQQAIIKAGVTLFSQVASSVEELKEKVEDARAEAEEQRMAHEE
ncbi:YtxH domain-containing protein [Chrysiogenes arsenatis]|uniref:YtxH domain-containing protein n=1 Tax=Chrysiogenes arsenatis TaxID=309797 RepID=UPI00040F8BD8|nr:YtxH domain-containing protein [Chrysiogenes arsenatis]